jgi:hypothetical protein
MLIERMRRRLAADTKFIERCLPSRADKPPSGSNWIREIKHDGYRLMARRDPGCTRAVSPYRPGFSQAILPGPYGRLAQTRSNGKVSVFAETT